MGTEGNHKYTHIYYDDNGGHGHSHVPCSPLSYCSRYHWRSPQPRLRAAAMRYGHVLVTNCRCRCCRRRALSLFHSPQQASYPAFWGHIWALGLVWVGRHCDRRTPAIRTITGSEFESVSAFNWDPRDAAGHCTALHHVGNPVSMVHVHLSALFQCLNLHFRGSRRARHDFKPERMNSVVSLLYHLIATSLHFSPL